MAGHSEWQNKKYRKRRQDRKKAKIFGKLSKKISSAARQGGGDPEKNASLRNVIERAKDENMPKENIERAILKGIGELPGADYEDHVYEGYGPGGVAGMVDVTTDNKNRSIAEIRKIFEDHGGKVGERGCVSYQFDRKGYLTVPGTETDEQTLFELVVEAGAEDVRSEGDEFQVICSVDRFADVKRVLNEAEIETRIAEVTQIPRTTVPVSGDNSEQALRLLETLDEHDDVQEVYCNFEMADEVFEDAQPTTAANG